MENTSLSEPPEPDSKIIGLTGGIGSGKSTVAKLIEEKGYPVYNSDFWAKELVNTNIQLRQEIINLLGENAYDKQGNYNRKWVSEKVFEDNQLLLQLNQLIHPQVKSHYENWVSEQKSNFIFKETALLFELNLDKSCDKTLLVTAEDNIRIKRVMDRDQKTYREVESIINKQMPEKDKIKLADFVIYNNAGFQELEVEFNKVFSQLITD